jgi:hypothetical protein
MFDHFCPFCDYLLTGVPNFETPEQWEKRTGEKWKGAVYFNLFSRKDGKSLYTDGRYQVSSTGEIIETIDRVMGLLGFPDCVVVVVCATEAGPPPDGWKPEEE